MGRGATKATSNVWYQARLEAAKWNQRLQSRAGAAEELGLSEDAVKSAELGLYKCMPVDTAVLMADGYNAPELLNHYCLHECPIGCNRPLSEEVVSIDRVTVKLMKKLRVEELEGFKDKLLDIAEDGVITEDELPDLREILDYLDGLARTVSELKIIGEKALRGDGTDGRQRGTAPDTQGRVRNNNGDTTR